MEGTLRHWIDSQPRGEIMRLVRVANVSASTIHDHLNGRRIRDYLVAQRISEATGGVVTIEALCEPRAPLSPDSGDDIATALHDDGSEAAQ